MKALHLRCDVGQSEITDHTSQQRHSTQIKFILLQHNVVALNVFVDNRGSVRVHYARDYVPAKQQLVEPGQTRQLCVAKSKGESCENSFRVVNDGLGTVYDFTSPLDFQENRMA